MDILAYLYDASGRDEKVEPADVNIAKLKEDQLLWIDVLRRDEAALERVAAAVNLKNIPIRATTDTSRRPRLENYDEFFHFSIDSVKMEKNASPEKIPIDFIVGKNFVVTVHEGEIDYFEEFRTREKSETLIGELDAESFLATLLDLHIVSYFQAMEEIERRVDEFDEKVLKTNMETEGFLAEMVGLRGDVSKLRRWLLPHREVFYSLTRADFRQIAKFDSNDEYKRLNEHFEKAVNAIENARETVLSIFDLYATKSSQNINTFLQRLTFLTLLTGSLSVIAGILGMNYKVDFFESPIGFWITVSGMGLIALSISFFARFKRWI